MTTFYEAVNDGSSMIVHRSWQGGDVYAEEGLDIRRGDPRRLFERHPLDLGHLLRRVEDVGGFIPLPPVRMRREKGGIRLHEEPLQGHTLDHVAQGIGLLEGDRTRNRDEESPVEALPGHTVIPGKTVDDAAVLPAFEHRQYFFMGVAIVDDDGQTHLGGQLQLLAEAPELHVPGGAVMEKVEADLTVCHDLVHLRQFSHGIVRPLFYALHVVRMDADGGIYRFVPLGEGYGHVAVLHIRPDGDDGGDARVPGPRHYLVAVAVEASYLKMGVGIYEHGNLLPLEVGRPLLDECSSAFRQIFRDEEIGDEIRFEQEPIFYGAC